MTLQLIGPQCLRAGGCSLSRVRKLDVESHSIEDWRDEHLSFADTACLGVALPLSLRCLRKTCLLRPFDRPLCLQQCQPYEKLEVAARNIMTTPLFFVGADSTIDGCVPVRQDRITNFLFCCFAPTDGSIFFTVLIRGSNHFALHSKYCRQWSLAGWWHMSEYM